RTTADELLLVEGGRVEPFPGDLDDYAGRVTTSSGGAGTASTAAHGAAARQARRREAALARQRRQPLVREVRTVEQELEDRQHLLAGIEQELARPELYAEADDGRLQELMVRQGSLRKEIAALEGRWLELQERLESME
ncbi:MAG: ABC transporter ATP-binding protein, partial [Gammaproteobacteria bacterium]